jgi:hypothetical protein
VEEQVVEALDRLPSLLPGRLAHLILVAVAAAVRQTVLLLVLVLLVVLV